MSMTGSSMLSSADLSTSSLDPSNSDMAASPAFKQQRRAERPLSALTDAETTPGAQRELRFGNGEDSCPEETALRADGAQSKAEPPADATSEMSPDANEPFVLAPETTLDDGSARHVRHFAVALHELIRPRSERGQQRALRAAEAWHRDLLGLLSRWSSGAEFRLRYWTHPSREASAPGEGTHRTAQGEDERQLRVGLVVTAWATESETAEARAARLSQELLGFLQGSAPASSSIYDVRPARTEEALRWWLAPLRGGTGLRLDRPALDLQAQEGSPVGFGTGPSGASGPEVPGVAEGSGPERSLSRFGRAMLEQSAPSLLSITLRPTSLRPRELSRLRSIARGEATSGTGLSGGEEEATIAFSEGLIRQARRCFEMDVLLAQPQRPVSPGLQAAVEQGFFGGLGRMETEKVSLETRSGLLRPTMPASTKRRASAPSTSQTGDCSSTGENGSIGEDGGRLRRLRGTEEATRLFRFPAPSMGEVPGVSRSHPAPRHVPSGLSGEGPLLGRKKDSRKNKEVRLHPEDMFHHVYVLGQTGTGKTTMLGSMMMERIEAGAGVGLIDPHGDLYDQVRRAIPAGRRGDVVLFDPTDPGNDAALNLLEYDPERPRQRSRLINELFQIFDQEYDLKRTGGPMFEKYMRGALLLVMDDPEEPGTLLDVVRLFQDEEYRETLLQACDNERVVQFWRQAESTPDTGDLPSPNNMAIYVTSKLSRFIDDDYLRSLVNQRHSTLDFRQVIDSGKILLVKMTKGRLGQIGMRMFGTIIVTRLMMAALAREGIPEEERRDFYLFVDEFQNFTTPTIANLLSEARKYRLSLTLANQTLYQLEDEIADAVLGNAGSLVALRPGVKDFGRIEPYVSPPFSREEITNLPNYKAVARLLAGGEPTRPFLFETTPRL